MGLPYFLYFVGIVQVTTIVIIIKIDILRRNFIPSVLLALEGKVQKHHQQHQQHLYKISKLFLLIKMKDRYTVSKARVYTNKAKKSNNEKIKTFITIAQKLYN